MGIKSKVLISLSIFVLLYGGYYLGVPAILNSSNSTEFLKSYIQKEYGFNTQIVNPHIKMGFLPSVWVKSDAFKILNSDSTSALELKNVNAKIRLLPLILSKAEITHFSADDLKINLIFDKNSQLKLGQYPLIGMSQPKVNIHQAVLKIGGYNVNLFDELKNKNIILNGSYFTLFDFVDNKRIKFATDAELFVGAKTSKIKADVDLKLPLTHISEDQAHVFGTIEDLNLGDFSSYVASLSKGRIKSIDGSLNLAVSTSVMPDNHNKINSKIVVDNLSIMQEDIAASIYCKDKITILSDLSLIKNGVKINEASIKTPGIDAFLRGKISRLNTKLPNLAITATINKSKIENILPLLPKDLDTGADINIYLLKKYGYFGDIIGNLEIKGDFKTPSVYGNILSENGYLIKPLPNNTPKATIKMKFNGDKLRLNAHVPASQTQTVWVKGDINLYGGKEADLNITSTKNVDLAIAQSVLNPLHEILKFDLGPVPIMDIKGKGNINLHVIGTRKNPHGWGEFNFDETTASFLDIHNLTLKNGKGTLSFDDQKTHFITEKASLNGKPLTVDGTCTLLGVLDFKVSSNEQNSADLIKIINTSPMLKDIQTVLAPIKSAHGKTNLKLNLTGQVRDILDVAFNKNIFAKGQIEFISNNIEMKYLPLPLKNVTGILNFNNLDADFNLTSSLNNSEIITSGKIKDMIMNTKVVSNRFNLGDAVKFTVPEGKKVPFASDLSTINTSFTASYKGPIDNIAYDEIALKGKLYSNKGSKSSIIVDNTSFELNKSHFKLPSVRGTFKKNPFYISVDASKIFSANRDINGHFSMKNFNLSVLDDLKNLDIFPASFYPDDIKDLSGVINLDARIRHNNINFFTKLDGISLTYTPKKLKIKFNSGNLLVRNDVVNLGKITGFMGEMPIFADGKVSDIYKNPDINIYINAKPTQEFFDQFFNNKAVYPIKMKGDIICSSRISGTKDRLSSKTDLKIEENSSLYYMGATIGDISNPVKIYLDSVNTPSWIRVNNFKYDKIIASQNNKNFSNTQLTSSGTVEFLPNNNVKFHNFRVKTQNPTDAKIFNIIFRKPLMKQGIFTSDLLINGTALAPKIIGKLDVTSIDMPFFDATIKDVNLDFKNDKIYITTKGTVLSNNLNLTAVMKNDLTLPYVFENIKLKLKDLNINNITDMIRDYESDMYRNKSAASNAQNFDLSQIVIKKAEVEADTVKVKNVSAENFKAELSLNDKLVLDMKKFKFKLAEGFVDGSFKYDFVTNRLNLLMHMKDSNAQIISEALFNLQNQIFGSITGDIALQCSAKTPDSCTKTLSGDGYFIVADGRMPKLGSLEYLLKAGNLLRGGITGLSINSIVDLITPLKTGEFESISGNLHISDGIVQNVNIYSNGKDLNMYLKGSYNISNALADMTVFGTLSNNLTSVFGKVKNASLNSLLNTIPFMNKNELNPITMAEINKIPNIDTQNIYRIFTAEIFGDINGSNYVRSFKWIK